MATLRLGLTALIFVLFLALPLGASAEDEAKYSFASAQGDINLQAIPGGDAVSGRLYFYNVDGNRITYISLEVVEKPADWEVTITPAAQDIDVQVAPGPPPVIVTVEDVNVYAQPTAVSATEITNVQTYCQQNGYTYANDMVSLTLPSKLGKVLTGTVTGTFQADEQVTGGTSGATGNVDDAGSGYIAVDQVSGTFQEGETVAGAVSGATIVLTSIEGIPGYAVARTAVITVSVPASEAIGTTGAIKITAEASWLGQAGSAAISQTRDFDFTYTTVYEITQEQIVTGGGFDIGRWLPVIIAAAVVILGGGFFYRFAPRRK